MCYDAESGTKLALKYAQHRGDEGTVKALTRQLELFRMDFPAYYHVSGFVHPPLLVFTNQQPLVPQAFTWGLIPAWTKNLAEAKKLWNNTLNARAESIFEKPAFKQSAIHKRCIIYLDAFYEHRHLNKKTFPYRIAMKDQSPMAIAGLWEERQDKSSGEHMQTVSIITTEANALMQKIHNNPGAEGPRMPVILPKEKQDEWFIDCKTDNDLKHLKSLMTAIDNDVLSAYPVGKLHGKNAIGNHAMVETEVHYPELDQEGEAPKQFSLFDE
ncbi:MAG: SOS response-associated peptidase [Bacteroidota bacterium]